MNIYSAAIILIILSGFVSANKSIEIDISQQRLYVYEDKSIIARHLISDPHNPFNREDLDMKKLEEYNNTPEIIEKIKTFKLKLQEWKQSI